MVACESSFADRTGTQFVVSAGIVAACRSVKAVPPAAASAHASIDPRVAVSIDCGSVPYRVSFGDARPPLSLGAVPVSGGRTSVAAGDGQVTVRVEF